MGQVWDAFYVLLDEEEQMVKFGITSGNARPRLAGHARDGYCTRVRLMTDLPLGAARGLEKTVLATLDLAGVEPVRGREYFHVSALPVILDIADNYPIPASKPRPA
jgi:hypothetical protein